METAPVSPDNGGYSVEEARRRAKSIHVRLEHGFWRRFRNLLEYALLLAAVVFAVLYAGGVVDFPSLQALIGDRFNGVMFLIGALSILAYTRYYTTLSEVRRTRDEGMEQAHRNFDRITELRNSLNDRE